MSPRGSTLLLALSVLAVGLLSTPTSAHPDITPRQGWLGPYATASKCTCYSEQGKTRLELLCEGLSGLADYGRVEKGWNVCYVYGPNAGAKAAAQFSDKKCEASFGKGFKGECVDFPDTPGLKSNPAPQPVDTSPCCRELITNGYVPWPDCCETLNIVMNPGWPL